MKRKTIAVLCIDFSVNGQKHGYSVTFEFYKALSEKYDIKVIVPTTWSFYQNASIYVNQYMSIHRIFPDAESAVRYLKHGILNYFCKHAHENPHLVEMFKTTANDADLIICEGYYFANFAKMVFPGKTVCLRSIDIEYDKVCQEYEYTQQHPTKVAKEQWDKYKAEIFDIENEAYLSADVVFTLTQGDAQRLKELYKQVISSYYVLPICLPDCSHLAGFLPKQRVIGKQANCFYVGFENYASFATVRKIAEISESIPEVVFHIVGRAGLCLTGTPLPDNVIIYGVVDDNKLNEIKAMCDFAIMMTNQTYGMNAKIMTYFASGLPLVSNKIGVRGYDVNEYVEYFPASCESLTDDIRAFLRLSDAQRHKMALKAFEYICDKHDYRMFLYYVDNILDAQKDDKNDTSGLYLFGAGEGGKKALQGLMQNGYNCLGFVDNNELKHGTEYIGLPILSPKEAFAAIKRDLSKKIVITVENPKLLADIYQQITNELGLNCLYIYWNDMTDLDDFNDMCRIDRNKFIEFCSIWEACNEEKSDKPTSKTQLN